MKKLITIRIEKNEEEIAVKTANNSTITIGENPMKCGIINGTAMLACLMLVALTTLCGTGTARADSITLKSDATTLAAALGQGDPSSEEAPVWWARLNTPDTSGLTFVPVLVGSYGSWTPVPAGAPDGTVVVNIPTPGNWDGRSGYFEMTFTLPNGFTNIQLTGQANVDDCGRVFLNGNPISADLGWNTGGVWEYGDTVFTTAEPTFFQPGVNTLLISDSDIQYGGPSGGAFYANITYNPVPEPATILLLGLGGLALRRRSGQALLRNRKK